MTEILIVEDDISIAVGLEDDLSLEGYSVEVAADGDTALARAREKNFALILLDVMLPRRDGFEVCRQLRRTGVQSAIVLLTAKTEESDKILGLELGADDYITKPFSSRELRSRIKAVLRRCAPDRPRIYRFGDVEVDVERCLVSRADGAVDLTLTEFKLLCALIRAQGRALTRSQLIDEAWGHGVFVSDRVVDNHILNLRKKLEPDPAEPRHIVSIRSIGYRFQP
jgi:DNA-binding response OmpR family regulator